MKQIALQKKAWERQQEELDRLNEVIERFKHKPTKAAFARAKKKQIERMELVAKPEEDDVHLFTGELTPELTGSKWVLDADKLRLGYRDHPLFELTLRIRRGQKVGLIGPNGAGKTTFLKTAAGLIAALSGDLTIGQHVTIGYFDQHSAELTSEKSVVEHFHELFPAMTEKDVRSVLGAFLFGGKEASRRVSDLSGGEKARLVLAELLQSRPNFLILDEPTNHMDIQARETLESAFRAYTGTILFVSHDRYFIRQVAESILIFENRTAMYYPFGYEHYTERLRRVNREQPIAAQIRAEDQALIEGLRAVPKAERHRLREIPTEEAYHDWKLRLIAERMIPAGEKYGALAALAEEKRSLQRESEVWWFPPAVSAADPEPKTRESGACETQAGTGEDELTAVLRAENEAWESWHAACLEWWDEYSEALLF